MDMKQSVQEDKTESLLIEKEKERQYEFPYGLKITLDEKTMRKLEKRPEDFQVGEEVFVAAKASVKSVIKGEGEYAENSVCLQIEEMSVKEPPKNQETYAERMYGKE
jgi:hypothetical protein